MVNIALGYTLFVSGGVATNIDPEQIFWFVASEQGQVCLNTKCEHNRS